MPYGGGCLVAPSFSGDVFIIRFKSIYELTTVTLIGIYKNYLAVVHGGVLFGIGEYV